MIDYWKKQDLFHERMKKEYEGGVITNPIYKPYFEWKFYGASVELLTKQMCYGIMKEAQKELEELDTKHPHQDYGEDSNLYSYLIPIRSFGRLRYEETKNVILRHRRNWQSWVGIALSYGNVS